VKTDVEELSPTRVRLSVEVPFDELKPSLDKAYREVGRQVRIPGFRPGRVPPPVIDRRVGRDVVLTQAVNDAIPDLYAKAVAEGDIIALGQPEVEITNLDDGKELTFTVEVDIRPKFDLPDLSSLSVTVDNTLVTPDEVAERLAMLQDRFASLKGVQRPVEDVVWGLLPGSTEPKTLLTGGKGGNPFHATLACKGGQMAPLEGTYAILDPELREGVIVAHLATRERAQKPRLMEDVLASIPEAVAIVHGGHVVYTNPAFTQMFGFAAEEVSGGNLRDFIVPETRQHENATLQKMLTEQGRICVETVRLTKSGELVDVAMQIAPLMVNGAVSGHVYRPLDT